MEPRKTTAEFPRQVTSYHELVTSDLITYSTTTRTEPVTSSLPFATFDGITWMPNVSPEKERWPNTEKTETGLPVSTQTKSDCERDLVYAEPYMQVYKVLKDAGNSNVTETKHLLLNTIHDTLSQMHKQKERSNAAEISSQVLYMLPQMNVNTSTTTDSLLPQTSPIGEGVAYQSKLKKAVTKAKAKKRGKASIQQSAVTNIIDTYTRPLVASGMSQEVPTSESAARLVGGPEQPDTSSLLIAVPLTNIAMAPGNDSEVHITPHQYHDLLSSEMTEVSSHGMFGANRADAELTKIATDRGTTGDKPYQNVINNRSEVMVSNVSNIVPEVTSLSNSELDLLNQRFSAFPKFGQVIEPVTEKIYEDSNLSGTIIEAMWHMIEADLFWDAVLYVGKHHVKLHKLVLASVSCVVHAKMISNDESVLNLKLPAELDHNVVRSFVKYLYHGVIIITLENVQDLYRISTIFEIDLLKKYCYDFCKLTKMAHIIINSPQEDTVKAVPFGGPDNKTEDNDITVVTDGIANTTTELIENIDLEASEIAIQFAKIEDKKEEIVFDWTGVDENESNIPIRKRGRSRKGMRNSNIAFKSIAAVEDNCVTDASVSDNAHVPDKEDTISLANNALNSERQAKESGTGNNFTEIRFKHPDDNRKTSTESKDSSDQIHLKEIDEPQTINAFLPDPFDSGKFDESKLKRNIEFNPPTSAMVTRYRGRNKNILKAAENKKARMDDNTENGPREIQAIQDEPKKPERKTSRKPDKIPIKRSRSARGKQVSSPTGRPEVTSEPEVVIERICDTALDTPDTPQTFEKSMHSPQLVTKKLRSKRSITEPEVPQKKEAPMRPPPKKRTKEISEMMKNVDKNNEVPVGKMLQESIVVTTKKKNERKKPRAKSNNLSLPKTEELMDKIAEIDEKGRQIEGERMFRCGFCGNEYLCVKRILSHVVNSHEVFLDKSVEHITVLKKDLSPKVCDICGYNAKDANFYYIHFHKYFRHGVALPQGWKPFKCDFCHKEFFTKFQLTEHKLIHFEDTPFVCEHCGNGFKTRTCLNSHVFHKHSSIKKHKCSECSKSFKTRTQMLVHMRTHSGEKPFSCPNCSYKSTTRGNMRLHLTNRHKLETGDIKRIMENLKATEVEISVDEDGNIIKMKESGFAVKLGAGDGQVLQIDPAGSTETQSMETLAHVASDKASDSFEEKLRNGTESIGTQDQTLITDVEILKSSDGVVRNRIINLNDEKQNGMGSHGMHNLREEFIAQNNSHSAEMVFSYTEMDNNIDERMLNSGSFPVDTYRSHDVAASGQTEQIQMSEDRVLPASAIQAQEPRLTVREVLQRLEQRSVGDNRSLSLLKEALEQSHSFNPRDAAAAEIIEVSEAFFQESNMMLNSQSEQSSEMLHTQYVNNNRRQEYETPKDFSAEPLQLVTNTTNLQNKQDRHTEQVYQTTALPSQSCSIKHSEQVVASRLTEIPTVIAEEIQELESIPAPGQPQALTKSQSDVMTPKPETEQLTTEEQQLMFDSYYPANYHHGYQHSSR